MALTACKECGGKVADSASTCPHCGVDAPAGVAELVVKRRTQLAGARVETWMAVDGNDEGDIGPGEIKQFRLKPGVHQVSLSWNGGFRRVGESVDVSLRPAQTTYVEIECKVGMSMRVIFHVS